MTRALGLALASISLGLLARFVLTDHGGVSALAALGALVSAIAALARFSRSGRPLAHVFAPALFGLLVLWAWEMLVMALHIPFILLPPPSRIAAAFASRLGMFAGDFNQTILHAALAGYVIGNLAGFLLALAIDRLPFIQRGLTPFATMASAIPIVGIAPIMIMWFGFDWPSKAAVVALMTLFPMLVNTSAGLKQAGQLEGDLMRSYGAGYGATLCKLRLPAAMPLIFNALKINSTLALIGAVVAEFFGTPIRGMGFRISTEAARMNLDVVWATIAIAALTGTLSFAALTWCERRVTFWHPAIRTRRAG